MGPGRRTIHHLTASAQTPHATALGDVMVASTGLLSGVLLVAADRGQRLGLALLALVLLATMTAVATHTAVVGRHPTRGRRILGAVLAVVATVLFIASSTHRIALLVPAVAVAAGLGRTGSWPLRLVGLMALVVGALLV